MNPVLLITTIINSKRMKNHPSASIHNVECENCDKVTLFVLSHLSNVASKDQRDDVQEG